MTISEESRQFIQDNFWVRVLHALVAFGLGHWRGTPDELLTAMESCCSWLHDKYTLPAVPELLVCLGDLRFKHQLASALDVTIVAETDEYKPVQTTDVVNIYNSDRKAYFDKLNQVSHLEYEMRKKKDEIQQLTEELECDKARLDSLEDLVERIWPHHQLYM